LLFLRTNNHLTNEIFQIKRDYLSTLQSFFIFKNANEGNEQNYLVVKENTHSSSSDIATHTSPFNNNETTQLFGGNKVFVAELV
jgi:hypothetical protein